MGTTLWHVRRKLGQLDQAIAVGIAVAQRVEHCPGEVAMPLTQPRNDTFAGLRSRAGGGEHRTAGRLVQPADGRLGGRRIGAGALVPGNQRATLARVEEDNGLLSLEAVREPVLEVGRCVRDSRAASVSDALQPAAQCRTRDGFERTHIGIDLRHAHRVGCPSGSGTPKGLEIVPNRGMRRE